MQSFEKYTTDELKLPRVVIYASRVSSMYQRFFEIMTEHTSFQDVLSSIMTLPREHIAKSVQNLTTQEKELMAELLMRRAQDEMQKEFDREDVMEGEELPESTIQSIEAAKRSLSIATDLVPSNAEIWYERGLTYASLETDKDIEEALEYFDIATKLDSRLFNAWYAWATCLTRLAFTSNDSDLMQIGHEKYKKAATVLTNEITDAEKGEFYWNWALLLAMIARHSGEASDLKACLNAFREAKELGERSDDFLSDFAEALFDFALLVNHEDSLTEAIGYFEKTVPQSLEKATPADAEERLAWTQRFYRLGLARSYHFGAHLTRANLQKTADAFDAATKLDPTFADAWGEWGAILLFGARVWQSVGLVRLACDKLQTAMALAPDSVSLCARLAEGLALLGAADDDINLMKQAEEKLAKAALLPEALESHELTVSRIHVLLELGRYFRADTYFYEAIKLVNIALDESSNNGVLHSLAAEAKFALGDLKEDDLYFEEALLHFEIASKSPLGRLAAIWNEWGLCLLRLHSLTLDINHLRASEEKFERALTMHQEVNPAWLHNFGICVDIIGEKDEDPEAIHRAIKAFESALQIDSSYMSARRHLAIALAHAAALEDSVEAYLEAFTHFRAVTEIEPEDDIAWMEWAIAITHLIDLTDDSTIPSDPSLLEEAEHHFLEALKLGIDFANFFLATVYSRKNDLDKAVHYFDKAFELDLIPPLNTIQSDSWLENVRKTQYFRDLLPELELRELEEKG